MRMESLREGAVLAIDQLRGDSLTPFQAAIAQDQRLLVSEFGDTADTIVSVNPEDASDREEIARISHAQGYGIFAALSASTAELTVEAVKAANKHGTIVSYDLNYRPSLWKTIGGLKKAQEVNREIAKYVDVMIGNEEDFTASLGFEVKGVDHNISAIETDAFKAMIETAVKEYKNFKVAATTLRRVITATKNDPVGVRV